MLRSIYEVGFFYYIWKRNLAFEKYNKEEIDIKIALKGCPAHEFNSVNKKCYLSNFHSSN